MSQQDEENDADKIILEHRHDEEEAKENRRGKIIRAVPVKLYI